MPVIDLTIAAAMVLALLGVVFMIGMCIGELREFERNR